MPRCTQGEENTNATIVMKTGPHHMRNKSMQRKCTVYIPNTMHHTTATKSKTTPEMSQYKTTN
jgi:hypothetical protein